MEPRPVPRRRGELADPADEPANVAGQDLAGRAELLRHVVDEPVREHVDALEYHLFRVAVPLVAALRVQRDREQRRAGLVLVPDHLGHGQPAGTGHRGEHRLADAVAHCRVQETAVGSRQRIQPFGQCPEPLAQVGADERRRDDPLDGGHRVPRGEQRVATAGPAVLHRRAVAELDSAVVEFEQHRGGLTRLPHPAEAGNQRLPRVVEPVVASAGPDGQLVVEEEAGLDRDREYAGDAHHAAVSAATNSASSSRLARSLTRLPSSMSWMISATLLKIGPLKSRSTSSISVLRLRTTRSR